MTRCNTGDTGDKILATNKDKHQLLILGALRDAKLEGG